MTQDDIIAPMELALPPPVERYWQTDLQHSQQAARLAWVLSTVMALLTNISPATLLSDWPESPLKRVAFITGMPDFFLYAYIASVALMTLFVGMTIFVPRCRFRRAITFAGGIGGLISFAAYYLLAGMSIGLDFGNYSFILFLFGTANLAFAFILGMARNHEVLRELQRECRR